MRGCWSIGYIKAASRVYDLNSLVFKLPIKASKVKSYGSEFVLRERLDDWLSNVALGLTNPPRLQTCDDCLYYTSCSAEAGKQSLLWRFSYAVLAWATVLTPLCPPMQRSNCSTPSTPPYSQTLALENQMVGSSITHGLIGSNSRQHLAAPAAISMILPLDSTASSSGKRVRKNDFVDPCAIAPLKKRRIQVSRAACS